MEKSEQINELCAALVKFQGEVPVIPFDSEVKVSTKTGKEYKFKYASYPVIKETCSPFLLKNELAVSHLLGQKQMTTILVHSSGQYISKDMDLPLKNDMTAQEMGSVISYMKRYSFSVLLGLVTDEDDDANIADKNTFSKAVKPEQKPAAKPIITPKTEAWDNVVKAIAEGKRTTEDAKARYEIKAMDLILLEQHIESYKMNLYQSQND